jgi:hypothetical protein
VSATALALAATRALDDPGWNQALLGTVEALGGGSLDARRQPLELSACVAAAQHPMFELAERARDASTVKRDGDETWRGRRAPYQPHG